MPENSPTHIGTSDNPSRPSLRHGLVFLISESYPDGAPASVFSFARSGKNIDGEIYDFSSQIPGSSKRMFYQPRDRMRGRCRRPWLAAETLTGTGRRRTPIGLLGKVVGEAKRDRYRATAQGEIRRSCQT
jgi:hypothetical protein